MKACAAAVSIKRDVGALRDIRKEIQELRLFVLCTIAMLTHRQDDLEGAAALFRHRVGKRIDLLVDAIESEVRS